MPAGRSAAMEGDYSTRPGADTAFESVERLCRSLGITLTRQRRIVLEVLQQATDHPCATEIRRRISRKRRVALATVYRTLNMLTEAGVLKRSLFSDGRARYEILGRRALPHLIDVTTGEIVEVDDEDLARQIEKVAQRLGYRLVDFHLKILGAGAAK